MKNQLKKLYRRTMTGYQLFDSHGRIVGYAIRLLGTRKGFYAINYSDGFTFTRACVHASYLDSKCGMPLDVAVSMIYCPEVSVKKKAICNFYTPATIRDDYHFIFGTTDKEDRKTSGYFEAELSDKKISDYGYRKVQ